MSGGAPSKSATSRLLKELGKWPEEAKAETGIERLGPPNDEDLFTWEAVVNGKGIGGGYDGSYLPHIASTPDIGFLSRALTQSKSSTHRGSLAAQYKDSQPISLSAAQG